MDVLDRAGRIHRAIGAILGGLGGAIAAVWITDHLRLRGTGAQRDLFLLASVALGFLVCGAAVGIVHELLLRRGTRLPQAIVRRRRREITLRRRW
ncbi:MAG: hypothetical protein H0V17_09485 [Deltaproteobacteria bacterium]|nr:hypothetical protein [Deltaproteobacteria bacterium]